MSSKSKAPKTSCGSEDAPLRGRIANTKPFPKHPKVRTPAQMVKFYLANVVPLSPLAATPALVASGGGVPSVWRCRRCQRTFRVPGGGLGSSEASTVTEELRLHLQQIHSVYVTAKDYPVEWWVQ
jgi:hypothetical protein